MAIPEASGAGVATSSEATACRRVALVGSPNVGKTTLFNRLCGVRHKTSNFPGTTQEARIGVVRNEAEAPVQVIDLPGVYSLELDQSESQVVRQVLAGETAPKGEVVEAPDAVCVVLDATNLPKSLLLLGETLRRRLPMVVAINLVDAARRRGIHGDETKLAERLGCEVVLCSARTGEGVEALAEALSRSRIATAGPPGDQAGLEQWADDLAVEIFSGTADGAPDNFTDRLDRAFTHPVLGIIAFTVVMTGLFWMIFRLATIPMDWIEAAFGAISGWITGSFGEGVLVDLLANGIVGGVGATLVFLPQIVLLFFLIALLEDTGYLARAAFVMDRLLRAFGLNGHAFVPLLSSHACALPGIMAARAIPDRRDRLATILVAPFMSCSARIPVYALLVFVLFPKSPAMQAVAFTGCYALGVVAGLFSSLVARRTILRGRSRPMALELPSYRRPSVKTAALTSIDRGGIFLRKAGTVILAISIVLWWLSAYPHVEPPEAVQTMRAQAETLEGDASAELNEQADQLEAQHAAQHSFIARMGEAVQPVFAPLGYDRQLTVGVMASFAAREVFASTMAVITSGSDEIEGDGPREQLASAKRDDGTPIFTAAVAWSLLVYYVLAMQCLPTLAVTARESGHVKWALLQLAWMCGVAYVGALVTYQVLA